MFLFWYTNKPLFSLWFFGSLIALTLISFTLFGWLLTSSPFFFLQTNLAINTATTIAARTKELAEIIIIAVVESFMLFFGTFIFTLLLSININLSSFLSFALYTPCTKDKSLIFASLSIDALQEIAWSFKSINFGKWQVELIILSSSPFNDISYSFSSST